MIINCNYNYERNMGIVGINFFVLAEAFDNGLEFSKIYVVSNMMDLF